MSKKNSKDNSIILKLRDIRKEKGLTISSLADKAGIDYQKIGRAERGETSMTIDMLTKLANVMDVPLNQLLDEQDDSNSFYAGDSIVSDNLKLVNVIPLIYEQLDLFCTKYKIEVENSTKVQLATMMYKIVQDIRVNVKDDASVVKALFQGFDTIFERLVLTSEMSY